MSDAQPQAPLSVRQTLANQLAPMRNPYARAVRMVNDSLIERDVSLSDAARRGIVHNATLVETGEISATTGSFREVPILLGEARRCLRQGAYSETALFTFGAVLNASAAPLVGMPVMQFQAMPLANRIFQMDGDALFPGAGAERFEDW
jgi:hypothetical protein